MPGLFQCLVTLEDDMPTNQAIATRSDGFVASIATVGFFSWRSKNCK